MWRREKVKVEESLGKLAKKALFQIFSQTLITEENFWSKNMQLRASQPSREHLDIFLSKALEIGIFLPFSPNCPPVSP